MGEGGASRFATTHWSLVAALPGRDDTQESERAREALEHLCEAYWRPLYAYARYSGHSAEDARDLTQAFLARIIETRGLGGADPARGRFRSYLLGAMKHFMAHERGRARAKKRGGGWRLVAQDLADLESRILAHADSADVPDLDRRFDRDWARETTAAALLRLESEWGARGRAEEFRVLRPTLSGSEPDRSELAAQLGKSAGAVSVTIHRLRRRYAELIRDAVARTVADEGDVEDEMRHLIGVLREM